MKIQQQRMTCANGHVAEVELVIDAPVSVTVASMNAASCPECGSRKLFLGGAYADVPPVDAPLAERAAWWASRGERGLSSNTIYSVMTGEPLERDWHYMAPSDPDDFKRCRKLLDLIPEWRSRLGEVAAAHPKGWYGCALHWDEFDKLWDEESPKKTCPKLYAAMKVALAMRPESCVGG